MHDFSSSLFLMNFLGTFFVFVDFQFPGQSVCGMEGKKVID